MNAQSNAGRQPGDERRFDRGSWIASALGVSARTILMRPRPYIARIAWLIIVTLVIALFVLLELVLVLDAQIYRYHRVSGPIQRQQTKWMVYGLVMAFVGYGGVLFLVVIVYTGWTTNVFSVLFLKTLLPTFILLIPLFIRMAVLRAHLWDIDIIIRKTLVYSALTVLLTLIYFGGIVLVQQLTRSVTETSNLAIVVSTLVIAALFFPLRRRVQNAIDRRFYRRKDDAAKTLAAFSATVRDEVELDKLTAELIKVINETMQPTSVSLWLKPTDDHGQQTTTRGLSL